MMSATDGWTCADSAAGAALRAGQAGQYPFEERLLRRRLVVVIVVVVP
jgi:hypothetical protein